MGPVSRHLTILLALFLLALPLGCDDDDDGGRGGNGDVPGLTGPIDVPEAWWGVWEETRIAVDCSDPSAVADTSTSTVQICPEEDDVLDEADAFADVLEEVCDVTWTASQLRIVCDGAVQPEPIQFPQCTYDVDVDATVTLVDEDEYTYDWFVELLPAGTCGSLEQAAFCEDATGTATRISTSVDDCGDGSDPVTLTVSGGGNPGTVAFAPDEVDLVVSPDSTGWELTATNLTTDFANFQRVDLTVPPDVTPGSGWSVATPADSNDIDLRFSDTRDGALWELATFSGTATLSTRTTARLSGMIEGSGTLSDPSGSRTEQIDLDLEFDAAAGTVARPADALRDGLRALIHDALARRH